MQDKTLQTFTHLKTDIDDMLKIAEKALDSLVFIDKETQKSEPILTEHYYVKIRDTYKNLLDMSCQLDVWITHRDFTKNMTDAEKAEYFMGVYTKK